MIFLLASGIRMPYANLLTRMKSPTTRVGTIEPEGILNGSTRNERSRNTMRMTGKKLFGYSIHQGSFSSFSSRSEEHTSELQSRPHLVCRLLLEKKKDKLSTDLYPIIVMIIAVYKIYTIAVFIDIVYPINVLCNNDKNRKPQREIRSLLAYLWND